MARYIINKTNTGSKFTSKALSIPDTKLLLFPLPCFFVARISMTTQVRTWICGVRIDIDCIDSRCL